MTRLMSAAMRPALIVGSAPCSQSLSTASLHATTLIAINNAWRLRSDFDYCVYPSDFPSDQRPALTGDVGRHIGVTDYMEGVVAAGGITFGGATMAFATGYWAMHALRPNLLGFYGCDMVYEPVNGRTHFYGTGSADPLRAHPTLRSLEAKSCRLFLHALHSGTLCLNLSGLPASRLTFPRLSLDAFLLARRQLTCMLERVGESGLFGRLGAIYNSAKALEAAQPFEGGYRDGYFQIGKNPSNLAFIDRVDEVWLKARDELFEFQRLIDLALLADH